VKVVVTIVRADSSADDDEVDKAVEGVEGVEEEEGDEQDVGGASVGHVKRVPPVGSKRAAADRAKELASMDRLISKQDKRNDIAGITPKAGAYTRPLLSSTYALSVGCAPPLFRLSFLCARLCV